MLKTTTELQSIIKVGGGVSVDGKSKTTTELQSLASIANVSGATLLVRNVGSKTTSELQNIARLAPGKVIFEL